MWSTMKEEYLEIFKEGNESWIGHLELLLRSHDETIISYDANDDSVEIDNLYYRAIKEMKASPYIREINIPLDGGEYLTGLWGFYQKMPVLVYGVGSPLSSAELCLIVNQKDQAFFEKEFNLTA